MNNIIVFGDTHIRSEEPFYSAIEKFFKWCAEQPWNNSNNIMIHLGDLFHSNQPTPKDYGLAHWFLDYKLKFQRIYIMAGNGIHEYNRVKKTYAIDPLSHLDYDSIFIVKDLMEAVFYGVNILFLPWIPTSKYNMTMKEKYENLELQQNPDYVFGHFAHTEFFGTEIDIDYIPGKKRMGHLHIPTGDYVGVNVISRYDEKGIDCSIRSIDCKTLEEEVIPIPKFLDYESVKYGNKVRKTDYDLIYDILDAPSKDKAEQMYENCHIRQVHIKKDDNDVDTSESGDSLSINALFDSFAKKTKVNSKVKTLIKKVM